MISNSILATLRSIVGAPYLLDSAEDRISYSYDGTPIFKQLPDAIVIPRSVDHIVQILRLANDNHFAVVPRGSGSGLSGGSIPATNSVILLTNHWSRILEIDQRNLTAWVQPGVITGKLHEAVEALGLFYPPDPGSAVICTIGGNVAENAGGIRGLKYGVTKNYVLGMEVVLPSGEVIVTGGKSDNHDAGYSLKDLLIGSEGTLGVITRVLLRLIPKPQSTRTMLAYYSSLGDSAQTVSDIIASKITPAALEFLDNTTIRCVEEYAHLGLPTTIESLLLIEVDGRFAEVEEDAAKVVDICKRHGALEIKVASNEQEAVKLRAARKVAFSALARVRPTTILEDATVPRSEVAPMLESINRIARSYGLMFGNFGHAGDGNLHPTCLTDERDKQEIHRAEQAFAEIFQEAMRFGGTITGEHGVGLSKLKFLEKALGGPAINMMRKIKESVDPNGVLNPGKIFSLRPCCEGPLPSDRKQIRKSTDTETFI